MELEHPEDALASFREAFWNALQVLAWISTRDEQLTGYTSSNYSRDDGHFEEIPPGSGRMVEIKPRADLFFVAVFGAAEGAVQMDLFEAKRALCKELASGRVVAHGYLDGQGALLIPPQAFWAGATFEEDGGQVVALPPHGGTRGRWTDLRFDRLKILDAWPPLRPDQTLKTNETNQLSGEDAQATNGRVSPFEIRKWLDRLEANLNGAAPPSQKAIVARARQDFHGHEISRGPVTEEIKKRPALYRPKPGRRGRTNRA